MYLLKILIRMLDSSKVKMQFGRCFCISSSHIWCSENHRLTLLEVHLVSESDLDYVMKRGLFKCFVMVLDPNQNDFQWMGQNKRIWGIWRVFSRDVKRVQFWPKPETLEIKRVSVGREGKPWPDVVHRMLLKYLKKMNKMYRGPNF